MKRICARDPRQQNKESSYFSFSSRDALVIFFENFWNFHEKQLILGIFSTLLPSFSPTQPRTRPILRTHNGHPTRSTPARDRPVPGAPCWRFWINHKFLLRVGRVCIYPPSYKTGSAGGGCRDVFFMFFIVFFVYFYVFRCENTTSSSTWRILLFLYDGG
jgi:hypothetical protein